MRWIFYVILLKVISSFSICSSQDIHWSQINEIKSFQNPASISEDPEKIKFQLAIKDQWRSVTKPFQTIFGGIESKLRKVNNVSIGGMFYSDLVGDGKLNTNAFSFILKYDFNFIKNVNFNIGFSSGIINRNITFSNFKFDNQYNGYQFDNSLSSKEMYKNTSFTNFNLGLGVNSKITLKKNESISIGYSLTNLNPIKETFYQIDITRPIRHSIQFGYLKRINQFEISPFLIYTSQKPYNEIIFGSLLTKYQAKSFLNSIICGVYCRYADALIFNVGFSKSYFKTIISYDLNFSTLSKASNGKGGLEINIQYLIHKKVLKYPIQTKCSEYY